MRGSARVISALGPQRAPAVPSLEGGEHAAMWQGAKVAVIVPAYQEERLIGRTLRKLPSYVDGIYAVDDASSDATSEQVRSCGDPRVRLLRHAENRGVGAAIVTGYEQALADGFDLLAVMAADDQMDPAELPLLLAPVWGGVADYAKGNRFVHGDARRMPRRRRLGSQLLSILTRRATSLDVDDCQCGYTVLSSRAARRLPLAELWPRYGYPNDLLGMLAAAGCTVAEVPVRPIYADEDSGLRPYHLLVIGGVIARRWWRSRSELARFSHWLGRGREGGTRAAGAAHELRSRRGQSPWEQDAGQGQASQRMQEQEPSQSRGLRVGGAGRRRDSARHPEPATSEGCRTSSWSRG